MSVVQERKVLPRETVIMGYRFLFGREPESEEVIDFKMRLNNRGDLIGELLGSPEFRDQYPWMRLGSDAWVWVDTPFGFRLRVNLQDTAIGWPVVEGRYENVILGLTERLVQSGSVAVDIGANIGLFANFMASIVGIGGRVYAFEPLPHLFKSLRLSIEENNFGDIVVSHQVALADHAGEAKIVFAENTVNFGGAYLDFGDVVPDGHVALPIKVGPLRDYVNEEVIDFIKIDVEGAEYLVLASLGRRLAEMKTVILSEIHPAQMRKVSRRTPSQYISMMSAAGYSCTIIDDSGRQSGAVDQYDQEQPINVLFTVPN